jgi:hypothetical protein
MSADMKPTIRFDKKMSSDTKQSVNIIKIIESLSTPAFTPTIATALFRARLINVLTFGLRNRS